MRRALIVDIDDDRKPSIIISPVQVYKNEKLEVNPVLDMAILCEAVCTMIHLCHKEGIKKDSDSIRDCINHLKKGFIDENYKAFMTDEAKKAFGKSDNIKKIP